MAFKLWTLVAAAVCCSLCSTVRAGSSPGTEQISDVIDVRSFGAKGDGVTDDAAAINRAIAACQASPLGKVVRIPVGRYKISSPILIVPRSRGEQPSLSLIGADLPAPLASRTHASVLLPTFNDLPAVIIHRARGVHVANLVIFGLNQFEEKVTKGYPKSMSGMMKEENFIVGGCRDSRYSPYCAIAVDPFRDIKPPDGGYPGFVTYYSPAMDGGSSNVLLENISIHNFVVGVMLSSSGRAANTSEIGIDNIDVRGCKYSFACGGNQARDVTMRRCQAGAAYIGWDGCTFGDQQGTPPHLNDCSAGACKYLFCFPGDWGAIRIQGFYCEGCLSLGWFGPAFSTTTVSALVSGSEFDMFAPEDVTPDFALFSMCTTTFTGCTFGFSYAPRFLNLQCPMNFIGCAFHTPDPTEPRPLILENANANFLGCSARKSGGSPSILPEHLAAFTHIVANEAEVKVAGDGTATFTASQPPQVRETVVATGNTLPVERPHAGFPVYNWHGAGRCLQGRWKHGDALTCP